MDTKLVELANTGNWKEVVSVLIHNKNIHVNGSTLFKAIFANEYQVVAQFIRYGVRNFNTEMRLVECKGKDLREPTEEDECFG